MTAGSHTFPGGELLATVQPEAVPWSRLPSIVLTQLFQLLPWGDRYSASLVCKRWSQCFLEASLWKHATLPLGGRGGFYPVRTVLFLEKLGLHLQSVTVVDTLFASMDFGVRILSLLGNLRLRHLVIEHDRDSRASGDPAHTFSLVCVVHLLESQTSLQSLTFKDFLLSPVDGGSVLRVMRHSFMRLQHVALLNFIQFQRRNGDSALQCIASKIEHCLCAFTSLVALRVDYFLLTDRCLRTMAVNLKKTLTDLSVQCSNVAWCQFSFTGDAWEFLRSMCKKLKITLYLDIKSQEIARNCETLIGNIPHVDAVHLCSEDSREFPNERLRIFVSKLSRKYAHSLESFHTVGDVDSYNLEVLSVVQSCKKLRHLTMRSCRCLDLAIVFCSWQLQNKIRLKTLDCSVKLSGSALLHDIRRQEFRRIVEDYRECFDRLSVREDRTV